MRLSEFDFPFDPTLIAQHPIEPRDRARLLVLPRVHGPLRHASIDDLPDLLAPGDVLVLNDTKVMPARITGHKRRGGGLIEFLLVRQIGDGRWEALMKGRAPDGAVVDLDDRATATLVARTESGVVIELRSDEPIPALLGRIGRMPLPPYIKRPPVPEDDDWYQTIFAAKTGAVAAPTAGLHFTERLLARLASRGVRVVSVTLHVGPGTFQPIRVEDVTKHRMAPEHFEVPAGTAAVIGEAKQQGSRVIAVGTTVMRSIETAADEDGVVRATEGLSELFIMPGYRFRTVDALLTNFHLPRTTLVMLVAAFAGSERVRAAYAEAVRERYRFYSYGDAMLIL